MILQVTPPRLSDAATAGASANNVSEAATGRGSAAAERTVGRHGDLQATAPCHQLPDGETLSVPPGPADT